MSAKNSTYKMASSRQEPRLPVNWAVDMRVEDEANDRVVYTLNVCSTGMCLQGGPQRGGRIGMKAPVRLYLPGESPLTGIEAELKWQASQQGRELSGWQFTSMSAETQMVLARKLEILLPGMAEEASDLGTLERVIEAKRETGFFYDVGKALETIRDQGLFRSRYPSFFEYCRQRWQMSPDKAFLLINAAEIVDNISAQGASALPQNEALVKPLTKLLPDFQSKVWQTVLAHAADGQITVELVQKAVELVLRGQGWVVGNGEAGQYVDPEVSEVDPFTQKLGEAKRAFMQLCKVVTEFESIAQVRNKVDPYSDPYWWKNLNLVFRSNFAEGKDGRVEFKGFKAELELKQEGEAPPEPLPCWEILGIDPYASKEEAKKARARLVKEYHPDRIPTGVSEEFRRLATQRTREINRAYEEFIARR